MLPSEVPPLALDEWKPSLTDVFLANTKENMGYILSETGEFTMFPIATGQKRIVRYIGMTYNAVTPIRAWMVQEKEIKGDRTTFGERGIFLRLFQNSDELERTAYGIHSHKSIKKMLKEDDRYKSMGCILVSDDVLDVLLEILRKSKDGMRVMTTYGFDERIVNGESLNEWLAEKSATEIRLAQKN